MKVDEGLRGVIYVADVGQSLNSFADELVRYRQVNSGAVVGIFNHIAVFVHAHDTDCDIIERYYHSGGTLDTCS